MEVKSIKEQWKEMEKLYKIAGFKAVNITMKQYCKDISESVKEFN